MTLVEKTMRRFLAASQDALEKAVDPDTPEDLFRLLCSHSTLAGMCAYLLDALHANDQGEADEVAVALDAFAEDGEPLADWVSEQLNRRGI